MLTHDLMCSRNNKKQHQLNQKCKVVAEKWFRTKELFSRMKIIVYTNHPVCVFCVDLTKRCKSHVGECQGKLQNIDGQSNTKIVKRY
jgi:hypothetical protein